MKYLKNFIKFEKASSGRSKCGLCDRYIPQQTWRLPLQKGAGRFVNKKNFCEQCVVTEFEKAIHFVRTNY